MQNQILLKGLLAATIFSILGCAHSGVVKTGPDTYMVANSEWGLTSGGYQKAKAIDQAGKYCEGLGREILVISSKQNDVAFGKTPAAEVDFKCLPKGTPAAIRSAAPLKQLDGEQD
jgi:hypothetical protein